jgi:hypothetical protein
MSTTAPKTPAKSKTTAAANAAKASQDAAKREAARKKAEEVAKLEAAINPKPEPEATPKAEAKPKTPPKISDERARITAALTRGEMPEGIELHRAGWADEGQEIEAMILDGYQIVIEQMKTEAGKLLEVKWTVMATEAVSETPEMIDDSSRYAHKQLGRRQALRSAVFSLNKHLRSAKS